MCQVLNRNPNLSTQLSYYTPLTSPTGKIYVPLATDLHWPTNLLLTAAQPDNRVETFPDGNLKHMFSHEYLGETVTEERTAGERYQPVLVQGRRQITFPPTPTDCLFDGGVRDCYVHWLKMPGTSFTQASPMSSEDLISSSRGTKVFRAEKRRGGALYSRSVIFNQRGEPDGYGTLIILIELSWFLGPPDQVKIDLYAHAFRHQEERKEIRIPPFLQEYRPSLVDAWQLAEKGFERNCNAFPTDLKARRDLWLIGDSEYRARISERNWIEVFDEITEPWQLAEACSALEPPEFSHRRTPNKRGRDMVKAYCDQRPDRAQMIQQFWEEAGAMLKIRQ